ncbi:MAG: hypothetical protein K2Z81_16805 [Cyanobacteria bacterium]|nr:hypothetical protein [Cyanobacteriota bacterium]
MPNQALLEEKRVQYTEPQGNLASPRKALRFSRFIASLLVFALVCLGLSTVKFGALPAVDVAYPTWTSWAVSDFLKEKTGRPELVFMGSSLMLVPLDGVDADFTGKRIDASTHHKSLFFEKRMKDLTGLDVSTFNFALPGEMPSDAFMITRHLLKADKRPDVIVYGVGPRDFMDNLLPSPAATDPFRHLERFGDYHDRIDLIAPKWEERLSYEMRRACYPLGVSADLQNGAARATANVLSQLFPLTRKPDIHKRRLLLPDYHGMEIQLGECYFRPTTAKDRTAFTDNVEEYRKRYKTLKWDTFLAQMQFVADICNIAQNRGIEVVLVAMPITDINRGLLSDDAWAAYTDTLKALATSKKATFIDMHATGQFPRSDFGDTVHLHSGGGARLLDMIARRISKEHKVLSALDIRRDETDRSLAGLKESQL